MSSFKKEIAALEKVVKTLKVSDKTTSSKKVSTVKIHDEMKKCDLKKCTKAQLVEYAKKQKLDKKLEKMSKEKLVSLIWDSFKYEYVTDSSDSDSSDSDSDSSESDSDSDSD